ncbi:MAG: type II secretion system major pseudopilin GspG [Campylobacterota bacterium]|nr:type II secretion system major pseudopilin GspG [Campylobacterota bacterium]
MNPRRSHKKAFSLLELLVVILILGLLAALVAPQVLEQGERAKRDLVCTQMKTIGEALKTFKLDNGMYPDTEEGFAALVTNPDSDKYPNYLNAGYIERIPKDSWQTPITYIKNDDGYEMISFGGDRKEGGSGDGADIFLSQCNK